MVMWNMKKKTKQNKEMWELTVPLKINTMPHSSIKFLAYCFAKQTITVPAHFKLQQLKKA